MRSHSAHRHFGDVSEGLADGAAEDEHAHLLVESRDVGVPHKRLGPLVQKIDPVALPDDDLEGRKRRKYQRRSGGHVSVNSQQVEVFCVEQVGTLKICLRILFEW